MMKKAIAFILALILTAGCGSTAPAQETVLSGAGSASPASDTAADSAVTSESAVSDSAVSSDSFVSDSAFDSAAGAISSSDTGDTAAPSITLYNETVGDVTFTLTSAWTKQTQGTSNIYYRYLDKAGSYEAFILADSVKVDYSQYPSVMDALKYGAKESLPEGSKTKFELEVEVDHAPAYEIEFTTADGRNVCDMFLIAGSSAVTRMFFSQFAVGDVDYGTEFEAIWDTVRVASAASSASSAAPFSSETGSFKYAQSDYILNCYTAANGAAACDAMLEITNTGTSPIWLNDEASFDIYNESGSIIASCTKGNIDLIPEVILPGERGFYVTRKGIELPGGYFAGYNYELGGEINPLPANKQLHDYPGEIASFLDDNGRPSVLGYVTNDTNHTYPNIQLYVVYYDNDGRPVAAAHDYLGKLEPSSRSPFSLGGKLTFESASSSIVSSYELTAREAYNPE